MLFLLKSIRMDDVLAEADLSLPSKFVRHVVTKYDGQSITLLGAPGYEVGSYLGGGSAGVVYEATNVSTHDRVAVKIINPTGFRLLSTAILKQCVVASRGIPMDEDTLAGRKPVRTCFLRVYTAARSMFWPPAQSSR